MKRRLTQTEAIEFIEQAYNQGPDGISAGMVDRKFSGMVDVTVAACEPDLARTDLESFVARLADEIDLDTVSIVSDQIDDSDLPAVYIIIHTGSA